MKNPFQCYNLSPSRGFIFKLCLMIAYETILLDVDF